MSEELKPTDDQCDRLVSLTMEKLAAKGCDQYGDMTWTDLNPNIVEHHALRRSIVRVAYGAGEAEAIAAWNRRAQPEPAAPADDLAAEHNSPADLASRMQGLADMQTSARYADVLRKTCSVIAAHLRRLAEIDAAPSVAPEPVTEIQRLWVVNRYCLSGMCVDTDSKHEVGCTRHAAHPPRAPLTVDEAIYALASALGESKGWLRDYSDAVIRDAIDRKEPRALLTDAKWCADWLRNNYQHHLNIASLCEHMIEDAERAYGISAAAIGA